MDVASLTKELALNALPRVVPWQNKEGAWNKALTFLGLETTASMNHGDIVVNGGSDRVRKRAQEFIAEMLDTFRLVDATKDGAGRLNLEPITATLLKFKGQKPKRKK